MTENFPQFMKDTKPLIQEAQGTLCKKNTKKKKKIYIRYIIFSIPKIKVLKEA